MAARFDFAGKRVLVTGASRGIGRAISAELARAGAEVWAVARDEAALSELANEVGAANGKPLHTLVLDVTEDEQRVRAALAGLPPLDALVNNAGIGILEPVLQLTAAAIDRTFAVNVRAPLIWSRIVAESMQPGACIVNVSSQAGARPLPDHTAYCASKAALDMATRCLAAELGPKGIRVNSVRPTVVLTDLGRKNWSDEKKAGPLLAAMPLGRFAELHEVVASVLFLLSDASSLTTGSALPVDGGFLAM